MQPYVMCVSDLRRIGCCRLLFRISSLNTIVESGINYFYSFSFDQHILYMVWFMDLKLMCITFL